MATADVDDPAHSKVVYVRHEQSVGVVDLGHGGNRILYLRQTVRGIACADRRSGHDRGIVLCRLPIVYVADKCRPHRRNDRLHSSRILTN